MNKLVFLSVITFILLVSCQNKTSMYSIGETSIPGYWYNSKWIQLNTPEIHICGTNDIFVIKKRILIGGFIQKPSGTWIPGYWDNGIWNELPLPNNSFGGFVNNILIYNKDIYAAGSCYTKSEIPLCGYWKNGIWFSLSQENIDKGLLSSFAIDNDSIYWIGNYDHNFSKENNSGYYVNNQWIDLPIPNQYVAGEAKKIIIINKDIYILGLCTDSNGDMTACYWKNSIWHGYPSKDKKDYNEVWSLARNGDDTYIAVNKNGYWLNDKWIEFNTKHNETTFIRSIQIEGQAVYAAGHMYRGKKSIPGYWKNNKWFDLNLPYSNNNSFNALYKILVVSE